MRHNGFVIDIEANGFIFQATKIWNIHLRDLDGEDDLLIHPFMDDDAKEKFLGYFNKYKNPKVVFHNGLGYDIFVLKKLLGIEFTVGPDSIEGEVCQFVDTFYLSMFLNPDRERHSIEYFGEQLGKPKYDFRAELIAAGDLDKMAPKGEEFMKFHPLMDVYVVQDTLVGKETYEYLIREWINIYGDYDGTFTGAFKCGQKSFFLMSVQAITGWKFDQIGAVALAERIAIDMEEIRKRVEPQLPPRELKKSEINQYSFPAKPWKQDGTFSNHMLNFIEKHNLTVISETVVEYEGQKVDIVSKGLLPVKLPMEIGNQDNMKDWFLRGTVKDEFVSKYDNIEWVDDEI